VYNVEGPYGKGLLVQPTGEYIVFAAGTGVLCYLDLALQLALSLLGVASSVNRPDPDIERSSEVLSSEASEEIKE
jgi:hypothetical protein